MKKRFKDFIKKYWLCFLLSVIMILGMYLSDYYSDLYISGRGTIRMGLGGLYLLLIVPLYTFIYGCVSFAILKKIWVPQFVLYVIVFFYGLIFDIDYPDLGGPLMWAVYPIIFSLVGTAITALTYKIIKAIKQS